MARTVVLTMGSSPLTRGKPYIQTLAGQLSRLIPAHAGKTVAGHDAADCVPAHPRSRGENAFSASRPPSSRGSSPLTRGKPIGQLMPILTTGLIPAHAGKTWTAYCPIRYRQAHPRSRGENLINAHVRRGDHGSSPLTRGKLELGHPLCGSERLIPAHAGKTSVRPACRVPGAAHPRSRGENVRMVSPPQALMGSSPLTRGKHGVRLFRHCLFRLIPAHAGKTVVRVVIRILRWAHPRSRGENAQAQKRVIIKHGSSPLTRGKRAPHWIAALCTGLIPAHAGKTS